VKSDTLDQGRFALIGVTVLHSEIPEPPYLVRGLSSIWDLRCRIASPGISSYSDQSLFRSVPIQKSIQDEYVRRGYRVLRGCNGRLKATLLAVGWACLTACSEPPEAPPSRARPNVVMIVLDTTRADILSAYGYPKPTSPSLSLVASEGILFQQAMTTDFWTLPAHASLLTGEYPAVHQATAETNALSDGITTLAEYLRSAGYKTRAYVSNPWIGSERGFGQGFDTYIETWKSLPTTHNAYATDSAGIEGAQSWINEQNERGEDFFLFLNLNSAHMPYSPDPLTLVKISPTPRPTDRTRELRAIKGMWAYLGGKYSLTAEDFEILQDLYAAEVAMVDELVGRMVEFLRELNVLDNTLLIITSDHGENLGEHGMVDHLLSMYETTIRVPLIMRLPSSFSAGSESEELVSLVDIVPTVLDICGLAPLYPDIAARSLLNPNRSPHEFVIAENERPLNGINLMRKNFPDFDTASIDHRMKMLRTLQHKLIWYDDGRVEVYDLQSDPGELNDLSVLEPELSSRLLSQLEAWSAAQEDPRPSQPVEISDPETRDQLRALGYID
jgi:arylsulfatase A-like enzyme